MIDKPKPWLASPGQTDHVVYVDDLTEVDIARKGRNLLSVGSQHAKTLTPEEFKIILARVHPEMTQPRHKGTITSTEILRAARAKEVKFVIANHANAAHRRVHAESDPRILRAKSELVQFGCADIGVGNAAVI